MNKSKRKLIEEIKEAVQYMKMVDRGEAKTQSLKELLKK
ncbi:MAG: hypothetical protein RLZZ306_3458 [Bacteroidota bacterium]|jgi:hypothetical protein